MLSTLSSPSPPPPSLPPPPPPSSLPNLLKLSTSSSSSSPSWFVLLRSYAHSPDPAHKRRSLLLFRRILLIHLPLSSPSPSPSRPLRFSFPLALKSCAFLSALPEGAQLHALLTKLGLAPDTFVANSLVHFYASCGLLPLAHRVFDRIPARSRVSWNAIVDACVANAAHDAALALFRAMQRAAHPPDAFTLQSVLGACAASGALSLGMWAHALLLRAPGLGAGPVARDALINNSLVDLYAKCGAIDMARQVFDEMPQRDAASWNVLILGLAAHGRVAEALAAFADMPASARPNAITFVGVLSACNHAGLVDEGLRYLDLMITRFRIEPRLEHYGCVVDLLARAGRVDAALRVVAAMPRRPDAVIWRSLLDACAKSGTTTTTNLHLTESLAERALQFKDEDPAASGAYVLLSRVYASAQRWNDVAIIRRLMTEHGIRKEPGFSSVEADDGVLHQFVAGDTSHPRSADVYKKLDEIQRRLESAGYEPDCSQATMVAGADGVKGDSLRLHSEKLAIAFALLRRSGSAGEGAPPIRILKNLRVCRDCHTMSKLISRVYSVEIIVRDRIRFHHFKDGSCSCMDYW
uniref:DYW domain-containing protein n=1 Tax=Ananas comosus var. bracteatus TaxID=296719 RepID=A0A6V7QF91_ANACO|nr:unnamed protein product [Ananas comosus var. bracteatus]